jgi:hypothetical protein
MAAAQRCLLAARTAAADRARGRLIHDSASGQSVSWEREKIGWSTERESDRRPSTRISVLLGCRNWPQMVLGLEGVSARAQHATAPVSLATHYADLIFIVSFRAGCSPIFPHTIIKPGVNLFGCSPEIIAVGIRYLWKSKRSLLVVVQGILKQSCSAVDSGHEIISLDS